MRKETRKYYFSVEGETEKWYLDWLQKTINSDLRSKYNVKFDSKIKRDPVSRVKNLSPIGNIEITHIFDIESEATDHEKGFRKTLKRMKEAQDLDKNIVYKLGYSNLTFELWMILHKADCNGRKTKCKEYIPDLNNAYGEKFKDLQEYKNEDNFKKRILQNLTIEDVISAVERSKAIMKDNEEIYKLKNHEGYEYYKENPSLTVWEIIDKILRECGIM